MTTSPILAFPRFDHQFKLATDASDVGLGAVLFQEYGGREHVIAYARRTLHRPEKNYSVTEKETLALVWSTKIFRSYLYGRQFQLITDHCSLKWLRTIKDPRGRIARWVMVLEEHNWTIVHRAGKEIQMQMHYRGYHTYKGLRCGEDSGSITTGDRCSVVGFLTTPDWSTKKLRLSQTNDEVIAQVLAVLDGPRPAFKGKWR